MENLLIKWANSAKRTLEQEGYSVRVNDPVTPQKGISINLDGEQFVGDITYWKPDVFEFQFNRVSTGEVIFLKTVKLGSSDEIDAYMLTLFRTVLSRV